MINYSELIHHKQWNARPAPGIKNGTELHVGWVNFLDSSKNWMEIDCNFAQLSSGFEMTKAPFYFKAPKRSVEYAEMISNNRFDLFDGPNGPKTEITAPEFSQVIRCLGVEDVPGELFDINGNGRLDAVLYRGAYASTFAGDMIYFPEHGRAPRLKKLVRFNTAPSFDIAIEFEIEFSGKTELSPRNIPNGWTREQLRDKYQSDFNADPDNTKLNLHTNDGLYVRAWDEPQKRGIGIKKPLIWDSNPDPDLRKIHTIETYIKWISGNKYKLVKIIPKSFFTDAVFPVYTDTTSTFYPDPNPESTSVDGKVGVQLGLGIGITWSALVGHVGTFGEDDGATYSAVYIRSDNVSDKWRRLYRSVYLFDTSSIPDGDVINSGTFHSHGISKADNLGISPNINIYSSAPASNTALVAGDFDSLGSTAFSTAITFSNWLTTGYNNFVLNANGLAAISKTGVSKFGLRNANYDAADSAPSWSSNLVSQFSNYWAEESGTSKDPKLVVVHSSVVSINNFYNILIRRKTA